MRRVRPELHDAVLHGGPGHGGVGAPGGDVGILQSQGRGIIQMRDVRGLFRQGQGLHRFNKILSRAVETSYAFAGRKDHPQRCRHFSFIFDGCKIVSMGVNSPKTHPMNLRFNYTNRNRVKISSLVGTHSEMNAVMKFGLWDCRGLLLVNTRVNRNDELDSSRPCPGCMDMISSLGFKAVLHTVKGGWFEIMKF
jgi:hypothetical protein